MWEMGNWLGTPGTGLQPPHDRPFPFARCFLSDLRIWFVVRVLFSLRALISRFARGDFAPIWTFRFSPALRNSEFARFDVARYLFFLWGEWY